MEVCSNLNDIIGKLLVAEAEMVGVGCHHFGGLLCNNDPFDKQVDQGNK